MLDWIVAKLFSWAGILAIGLLIGRIFNFLRFYSANPSKPLESYKHAPPQRTYALITGSSAGIGFGIAKCLATKGFGVILLSHMKAELPESAEAIRKQTPDADVHTICMNGITATPKDMAKAVESVSHLPISILINNVGSNPIRLPAFRPLETYSAEDIDDVINLNARFMTHFTILMLPLLKKTSRKGQRSLILNVSSMGKIGFPYLAMYSATKGYIPSLSRALARELGVDPETQHIDCLTVVPGDVRSQGNRLAVTPGSPNSDEYGGMIVQKIDAAVAMSYREFTPYWKHAIMDWIVDALPEGVRTRLLLMSAEEKRKAWLEDYEKVR